MKINNILWKNSFLAALAASIISTGTVSAADSRFKVHFALYQHEITQDTPALVDQQKLQWIVREVPLTKENFLGFTDSQGTILQFFVDAPDKIWVEIPVAEKKGSYGKEIDPAQYRRIIDMLKEPFSAYIAELKLKLTPWGPPPKAVQ